jgi:hypothetical protein
MSQKFDKIEVDKNEKRFFQDVFEKVKVISYIEIV